jgi:leucyl-tRNA synthetase
MRSYDHKKIERKWQKRWKKLKLYETADTADDKANFYLLAEFPYPSGNLHIGHWYAFAVPDIFSRYKRMKGFNVMYPIGFDSFGLPAENAAIKHRVSPRKWTYDNIEKMSEQIKSMGNSFDWSRVVVTSDTDYYKWTQWLFLKLHEKGLVYKGVASVNWDPVDKTVLADEQVLPDGTAERSGAKVEKKELEQWFVRITDYADRLVEELDGLDWPEEIKDSQRNWIGRRQGSAINFSVKDSNEKITVFTTRADTLFGATYLVLAPEHTFVSRLKDNISNFDEVETYIKKAKAVREIDRTAPNREKTGVRLEGLVAVNPVNAEEIPIYIADYVLVNYGTGAIMAVPAHDDRDWEFAKKHGLPVKQVICDMYPDPICPVLDRAFTVDGRLVGSGKFDGMTSDDAKMAITDHVQGVSKYTYRLHDWLISRQRYWGCPIPIVYDPSGVPHAVPEEHLPWKLPEDVDSTPTGRAPLASSTELHERTEKIFGKGWTPEVDTMDTFVDSSWYFLRYCDPGNEKEFVSRDRLKRWMPVNRYSGGAEHTTVHVLYSRFFHKALYDLALVAESEPYLQRMNRGIILGTDGRKMSKRWSNIVDPDEWVLRVGADSVKIYLAFIGPYNTPGNYPWDLGGIIGVRRFLDRLWNLKHKVADGVNLPEHINSELHKTFKYVATDIESFKFNTAISQVMILVKKLERAESISKEVFENLLRVLAPFAPHLAEELWTEIGNTESIHLQHWPEHDDQAVESGAVTIAIQVAGKTRATLDIPRGSSESEVRMLVRDMPSVTRHMNNSEPKKVIFVSNRVINFII